MTLTFGPPEDCDYRDVLPYPALRIKIFFFVIWTE